MGSWRPGAEGEVEFPVSLPGPGEVTGPHGGGLRQAADTTGETEDHLSGLGNYREFFRNCRQHWAT